MAALVRVGRLSVPPFHSGESFLPDWGQLGKDARKALDSSVELAALPARLPLPAAPELS